jgi:GH15 family glucan-1,4-alpha-glucosidase
MRTAALVSTSGSIDWLCFPNFDSPSVFAAILDDEVGGRFEITPRESEFRSKQLYFPDTNVLVSRFFVESGVAEVADFMHVGPKAQRYDRRCVVRHVRSIRGNAALQMRCPLHLNLLDRHIEPRSPREACGSDRRCSIWHLDATCQFGLKGVRL